MDQTLYLLVDYHNLESKTVGTTLLEIEEYLVGRAAARLQPDDIASCRRVHVRLYGGWYEGDAFTRQAQGLAEQISASPVRFRFSHRGQQCFWLVKAELAVSLVSVPAVYLPHTYRKRQRLRGIGVADPVSVGCDPSRCRVLGIEKLVRDNRCPDCGTPGHRILWRTEQKLVDVMLATDVIALSSTPGVLACLVSSDDDFWPVLLHLASLKHRVYHIHGVTGRRTNQLYARHAPQTYFEIPLEEEPRHDS